MRVNPPVTGEADQRRLQAAARWGSAALGALILGAAQPADASAALQHGVHVDPGSPAGRQYAFPIDGARSEAAGGASSGPGAASPPLFGVGVTAPVRHRPASTPAPAAAKGSSSGGRASARRPGRAASRGRQIRAGTLGPPVRSTTAPASLGGGLSDDEWLAAAGGGTLVLIVGCGAGIALRRAS